MVMVMVLVMVMVMVVMMLMMRSNSGTCIFQTHLLHVELPTLCGRNAWLQVQKERRQPCTEITTSVIISEQFAAS